MDVKDNFDKAIYNSVFSQLVSINILVYFSPWVGLGFLISVLS